MRINFDHTVPNKTRLTGIVVGLALAFSSTPLLAQSKASISAAERDLAAYVQHNIQHKSGTLPDGFPLAISDVQDLKDARIGHGFQIYTVDPKELLAGRGDIHSMARPTGIWRFLININERVVGLATLEQINGKWETVAYGGAVLAQDLETSAGIYGNADRSNIRFIRIYQAQSDLLEVNNKEGGSRFAPLYSARQSLLLQRSGKDDGLLDGSELLGPLQAAVKKNMDANN
ncbi:hypothetical protein [Pseudoduganella violacea]|uniref:Uncharacterized protein n=1 Tax=Pseudoduganella violacea TaxID=1715466 RepID=A0A7W5FWR0_9BURK|nr:hypothetical protein [Pseudoduganella violacea]MBB3122077.1 hypothetical protein [Pseudoduganella violacea]